MGCRTTISRCRNPSLWDCAFFSMPHFPTLKNGHTGPMRNNIRPIMPKTCPGHPIGPSHEEGFGGSGPDKRTRRPSREIPDGLNGTGRDGNREIIPTPASQARKNGKSGIFPTILTLRGKKNKIIHAFVVKFCLKRLTIIQRNGERNMRSEKWKRKRKKRRLKIFLIVLAVLFLAVSAYLISMLISANKALETMHQPIAKSDKRQTELSLKDKEPFSVLLLGVDERPNDRGRSDTMIVLTVNPKTESVKMLSIPRDTYVEIVGRGTKDKINHAYAFGGVEMSVKTVENFLDIPIDYYIKINMEGFEEIVDAVGGITVYNDMDLRHGSYHFPKGEVTLDGKEALVFSRIRKEDPRGDFGRQLRQKLIIQAIMNKAASVSTLWNYQDMFAALGDNIKTNLTFNDLLNIQKNYSNARKNVEQLQFKKGSGGYIGNIWYYFADEEELADFQKILKDHLEIS